MDNFATLPPSYSHETRQAQLIAVTALFQCLSTFFFFCRVYSKVWLLRKCDTDDFVLLVAWLLSLATCITTYHEVSLGLGHRDASVDPKDRGPLELDGYISLLLFIAMLPIIKISLCITYRRIFYRDKISRYVMDIVLFLLFLTPIPLFFVATFQCRPVSAYWN
ncbi:hypothetical protein GQ44DRAFT_779003 [Phaeosphaeriaceae sp. PMI808]|nr:hypothetical protein GQ44DRAFT_779003 [Phaeosphaeriaceae sp. PMI808]